MLVAPSRAQISWPGCFRIIPTKYPRIDPFEDVAQPAERDAVLALYALGNDRIREELGQLQRVAPDDRVSGPGSSYIMAAFTHPNPAGSRFSDGLYGVFYAARALRVAIAETQYHLAAFYRSTNEAAGEMDELVLNVDVRARLHDLRGRQADFPRAYSPTSYSASQRLGMRLRAQGSWGIAYDSVRATGECAALFRPRALARCRERMVLTYLWDGARFIGQYEKRPLA